MKGKVEEEEEVRRIANEHCYCFPIPVLNYLPGLFDLILLKAL
jgi:hypothetical protein